MDSRHKQSGIKEESGQQTRLSKILTGVLEEDDELFYSLKPFQRQLNLVLFKSTNVSEGKKINKRSVDGVQQAVGESEREGTWRGPESPNLGVCQIAFSTA